MANGSSFEAFTPKRKLALVRSVVARAIGVFFSVGISFIAARLLSINDAGAFFLTIIFINLTSVVARMGLETTVIREVSLLGERWRILSGYTSSVIFSSVVAVFFLYIFLTTAHLNGIFLDVDVRAAALVFPIALIQLNSGFLKLFEHPASANFFETGVIGVVLSGIVLILLVSGFFFTSVNELLNVYFWAVAFSLLVQYVYMIFFVWKSSSSSGESRKIVREPFSVTLNRLVEASPVMLGSLLSQLIVWLPSLGLGLYGDTEGVAMLTVCIRVSAVLSILLVVINTVTAPIYAKKLAKKDYSYVERLNVRVSLICISCVAPLVLFISIFPSTLLKIFGDEFTVAGPALIVLCAGQLISLIAGSVGYIMLMAGLYAEVLKIQFIVFVYLIFSLMIVIPIGGYVGSAVCVATSMGLVNFLYSYQLNKRYGIRSLILLRWR